MPLKLHFTYDQENNDAVPFLWDEKRHVELENAHCISSKDDFSFLVRNVMQGSNRSRTLLLVDSQAAADVLARQLMADENASCTITDLGESRFCVGATLFSGSYDDGIPLVTILTSEKVDFDLDPSIAEITQIFDSAEDEFKTPLVIKEFDPDMEPI